MTQCKRGRLLQIIASIVVIGASATTDPLSAQTRFGWPDTPVAIEQYTSVEECLSAHMRVKDSVHRRSVWIDTLQNDLRESLTDAPVIAQTAGRCSMRFDPAHVSLRDWTLFVQLFLVAEKPADADIVFRRRLAEIDSGNRERFDTLRVAVLDTMIQIYLLNAPARLLTEEQLIEQWITLDALPDWDRSERLEEFLNLGKRAGDSTRARWAAEQIVRIASRLSDTQKNTEYFQRKFAHRHHKAIEHLSYLVLLDGLRRSSSAWVALKRANWQRVDTRNSGPMNPVLGQTAPKLTGEFWFGRDGEPLLGNAEAQSLNRTMDTTSRLPVEYPPRGKISLVLFLSHQCRAGGAQPWEFRYSVNCWSTYAALRRLATRYPELDITIAAQTVGYFWPNPPMEPMAEARLLSQWLIEFHRLPATLVISSTPFWYLEAPDSRRILENVLNRTEYAFGQDTPVQTMKAFLMDRDGVIIEAETLDRWNERNWDALIDILMRR